MTTGDPENFYAGYAAFKDYRQPGLKQKHIRWFDAEFWHPAECRSDMSMAEIGCGTGQFLTYLMAKGVTKIVGVEQDPRAVAAMNPSAAAVVNVIDVWTWLNGLPAETRFDRIAMLDVLEHFSADDGAHLLRELRRTLNADGRIVVRVPNMSSPWGAQHQFSDLTHKAAYTPISLRQLALATGYECIRIIPQRRGSPFRRIAEDMLNWTLSRILSEPPPLWSANMIAVLAPRSA